MSKKLWSILIVGILLRITLASSTFHPDLKAFQLGGMIFASGHILNLYDFTNPQIAVLNYPPLTYFLHGIFNFIFNNLLGLTLVNDYLLSQPPFFDLLFNLHLLLLKFPYLIFDIALAFLITKLFETGKDKFLAFTLWMFNPVNLYTTYMMGQYDLIPTFFIVASLVLIKKNKLNLASLILGLGIAFKIFPLLLLPPLALLGKSWWDKTRVGFLGLLPYFLTILPYLPSPSFRTTALAAEQLSKSFYASVPVSGGESLLLFPLIIGLFYFVYLYKKDDSSNLWTRFLSILLLFLILTHFHPQWFLWVTPLLIIDLIKYQFKHLLPITILLISFAASLFFFDPSLTIGIFGPINTSLYQTPSVWQMLNLDPDYNFARSIIQTLFSAAAIFMIYRYFPKLKNE